MGDSAGATPARETDEGNNEEMDVGAFSWLRLAELI